jgi:hypothetical protein
MGLIIPVQNDNDNVTDERYLTFLSFGMYVVAVRRSRLIVSTT